MALSNKAAVGSLTSAAVAFASAVLVLAVPAWHKGLPAGVTGALVLIVPLALTVLGGLWGAYKARHRATATEVAAFVKEAEGAIALLRAAQAEAVASPAAPSGLSGHVVAHDPPVQVVSPAAPSTATIPEDHSTA